MFRLFAPTRRWRVHLCATNSGQQTYAEALTRWLRASGHTILAAPDAPLADRIAAALLHRYYATLGEPGHGRSASTCTAACSRCGTRESRLAEGAAMRIVAARQFHLARHHPTAE